MGKSRRLSRASVEDATFDENDDEAERNALRAARDAEAERIKSPHAAAKQGRPAGAAGDAGAGGPAAWGEIADVYADCIKMCNDNKVNEKNSWSLNLIDHMRDVLAKPGASSADGGAQLDDSAGTTNFQFASCTLDAGVKIYAYRVDSVYTTAYRVLGGLNRTGAAPGEDAGCDEDGVRTDGAADGIADGTDGAPAAAKRAPRAKPARSVAATLSSAAQLDGRPAPSACVLDPLFHSLCAKFDAGGARGLLLANMALHGANGLSLVFDGEGEPDVADEPELGAMLRAQLPAAGLRRLAPSPTAVHTLGVADALCEFVDGKMAELGEPDFYGHGLAPSAAPSRSDGTSDARTADVSASAELSEQPWMRDDGSFECGLVGHIGDEGAAAFDGDDDDDDGADAHAQDAEAALAHLAAAADGGDDDDGDGAAADLALFGSLAAARDTPAGVASGARAGDDPDAGARAAAVDAAGGIAGYEDEALNLYAQPAHERRGAGWAGPAHWRWRAGAMGADVRPSTLRGARKEKKAELVLDVSRADHAANAAAVRAKPARGSNKLTALALSKAAAGPLTLPYDHHLTVEQLTALFARPHVRATRLRTLRAPADAGEVRTDAGALDAVGACSDDDGDGGACAGYDDADGFLASPAHAAAASPPTLAAAGGGALGESDGGAQPGWLAPPLAALPPEVTYAKVAKKVNIRMLKESLWNVLDTACAPPRGAAPSAQPAQSFKAAMTTLAAHAPAEAMRDVSVAYCFICLLHLANEKGLCVDGTAALTDLTISKPT